MKQFSNCGTVSCETNKINAVATYNYNCDAEQFGCNGKVFYWYSERTLFERSLTHQVCFTAVHPGVPRCYLN